MKCHECGSKITEDDSLGAEVATNKKKPIWADVCRDCYDDIVSTCLLCGEEDVMPSDVSEFILVKHELAATADRPPGIFEIMHRPFLSIPLIGGGSMNGSDVLFIDKLPKPDTTYEISGHICNQCAQPYRKIRRAAYGRRKMDRGWHRKDWALQREHTRSIILANPNMLCDLECEKDGFTDWADLQKLFCLPDDLPTYHEWLLLKYRDVKVYSTGGRGDRYGDCWLVLRPEPRYRHCAFSHGSDKAVEAGLFHASSLPTYPKMPDEKDVYHSPYDWARQHSISAIRKAIARGLITKRGTFSTNGRPHFYG